MAILANLTVQNPWQTLALLNPPHIYGSDAEIIRQHNLEYSIGNNFHIYLDAYPEPYIGDPEAPILLLNRNPGYKVFDPMAQPDPALTQLYRDNLRHQSTAYPFYPVSPTYAQHHKSTWWRESLGHWIARYGAARVGRAFFCVEFMPYHSPRYKSLREILPSQQYTLSMVAAKIKAGAVVIIMRGQSDWNRALTEIASNLGSAHVVKNVQTKSLSPQTAHRTGNLTTAAAAAVDQVLSTMS